jgi:hypothetical protein
MSKPIKFKSANVIYTGPEDRPDVGDMPVFKHHIGLTFIWKLSDRELSNVIATDGLIAISQLGHQLAPVTVGSVESIREYLEEHQLELEL